MFPSKTHFAVLLLAMMLAGCGRKAASEAEVAASQALYLTPPGVTSVTRQGDSLTISGQATPGARVRLASPAGAASEVAADDKGRWTLDLAAGTEPRIFGLSMTGGGRQVQGQGYLLTTPAGTAALLRAGAGAIRLDPQPTAQIGAIDFDRDGEAVVSGSAPVDAALSVQVDGRQALDGRADDSGRFSLALPRELAPGPHRIEVLGDGFDSAVTVEVSGPQPLVDGPLRSQLTTGGLRIDWLTPGGGVQSTLLTG